MKDKHYWQAQQRMSSVMAGLLHALEAGLDPANIIEDWQQTKQEIGDNADRERLLSLESHESLGVSATVEDRE